MAYLDIIPLADAKVSLKIDDTLSEDDANITRMIKASLSQVERITNYMLYARDQEYILDNYSVNVYDFPINSLVSPADATKVEKSIYTTYKTYDEDDLKLTLNVGYANVSDIPQDLIEVAYEMLDIMYYAPETGKSIKNDLSEFSQIILNNYKRFWI